MDELIKQLVTSGHLYFAVGLAVFCYVARWVAGRVDKMSDRHLAFVDQTAEDGKKVATCLESLAVCVQEIRNDQKNHMDICRRDK